MNHTYLDQNERNRNESDGNERQRAARPIDTQVRVHRVREQRESRTESGSHEVVAGEHRRCVVWVSVGEVIQDTVEEQERADGEP